MRFRVRRQQPTGIVIGVVVVVAAAAVVIAVVVVAAAVVVAVAVVVVVVTVVVVYRSPSQFTGQDEEILLHGLRVPCHRGGERREVGRGLDDVQGSGGQKVRMLQI